MVHMHEHQRLAGPRPEGTPGEPAFEARRAAYVARYCASVRDDPARRPTSWALPWCERRRSRR